MEAGEGKKKINEKLRCTAAPPAQAEGKKKSSAQLAIKRSLR
jgi:hypothetical protein